MGAVDSPEVGDSDALLEKRLTAYTTEGEPYLERLPDRPHGDRGAREPDAWRRTGHHVFSTSRHRLKQPKRWSASNATLEKRRARSQPRKLTRLNSELAQAKSTAEDGHISKTRFLAAGKPRHPATIERGAALRDEPRRAPERRRGFAAGRKPSTIRWRRSRRSSARCWIFRGSTRRHDDVDHQLQRSAT